MHSKVGNISLEVIKGDFLLTNLPKNTFILTRSRTGITHTQDFTSAWAVTVSSRPLADILSFYPNAKKTLLFTTEYF